jgi:ADP-ribose pyrophosphatase YjhB (NUDIX family)
MPALARNINPHISVDCVIFGFSKNRLRVLLIERTFRNEQGMAATDYKLPGDFISPSEDLDRAAARTLRELTGLSELYLQQFAVFGKPDRIHRSIDLNWLKETTGLEITRVVTAAYYALINITESRREFAIKNNASWIDLEEVRNLAFDHEEIIRGGLDHLQRSLRSEPIGFEMLPERFTISELQSLYEVILNCKLDNRNFRKKILRSSYLIRLEEKQSGVAHKPARYYQFDKNRYEKNRSENYTFNF